MNTKTAVDCKETPSRRRALVRGSGVGDLIAQLDTMTANALENNCGTLVLDMSGVDQVDSRFLSRLIGLALTLRRGGGKLVLENIQPELANLLVQMRLLDSQFEVQGPETF